MMILKSLMSGQKQASTFICCKGRLKFGLLAVLLLAILSLSLLPLQAQNAESLGRIEALFTAASDNGLSGVVLISRDGEIIFNQAYGEAVREWHVPNTVDSVFYIASLTKQFTAVSILMLQDDGLLNVQDPVCNYLPECPEILGEVTIYHLLTHTSGLPEPTEEAFEEYFTNTSSPDKILEWLESQTAIFAPGSSWQYSNTSFMLLGLLIAEVSENTYISYLRNNFFTPLEMPNTMLTGQTSIIENLAFPYTNGFSRATFFDYKLAFSAGGLHSSARDLYHFYEALYNGRLLSPESFALMMSPVTTFDEHNAALITNFIESVDGYSIISHGGQAPGYSSITARIPEANMNIIILANVEGEDIYFYMQLTAEVLMGDETS